jgi:CheY-like chemotaxis protein
VLITVHDTGTGIPADQVERVLEPFFTTKEPGTGTGLGLSMVYGFARQIGGTVVVDSSEGEGTSVSMYLPKAELDARVGPAGLEELMDDLPEEERRARVLLVDDDVDVAAAVEAMLAGLGYEVEVALGPEQALDHLKSAKPDLVITDVTMPGPMNGVLLGREIRERHPLLPVVLLTGNPGVITEPAEFPVVTKPVASHRLDTAIRQQLGSEEASSKVVRLFPGAGRSR